MPVVRLTSPVGPLVVEERDGRIVRIDWTEPPVPKGRPPTALLRRAAEQFAAYFDGTLTDFDLPLAPAGTDFQKRVWAAMAEIPYGETRTYGELAGASRGSARAVGRACGANPLPIVVPCHRVTAAHGMGGYSGRGGLLTKQKLLDLEMRKTRLL